MRKNPLKSKGLHSLWSIGANKIRSLNNQRMQSSRTQATLSEGTFTAWFVSQTLFFCNLIVDVRRNSVLLTGRDKPAKKILCDATCRDALTNRKPLGTGFQFRRGKCAF
jgi:hypothetical protein